MKSVHVMDYPKSLNTLGHSIVEEMEIIREICSAILSIRKRFNLRSRLPLSKVTIIGERAVSLEVYKKFILEEANVKKIILDPNFSRESKLKLDIIFDKAGKKLGSKMPSVLKALKEDNWKKLSNGSILIADEILTSEDFNLKLIPIFEGDNYESVGSDFLVILDTAVSEELKMEGLVRDFVRVLQNARKELDLAVSDKINLYYNGSEKFEEAILVNSNYIKEQCLISRLIKSTGGNFTKQSIDDLEIHFKIEKI